ncbi:MAG: hypothetical protein RL040_826 [Bacteroidota bacterium]|jgi:uncharacterized protein (TIGR02145 family)
MRFLLLIVFTFLNLLVNAQAPALIPYQAIARNAAGEPLSNATVNARFTIHDVTATGASVWQELQTVTTSTLGLFTAKLGSSVSLNSVNWAGGAKFMQVELDLGSGFVDIGTQQLLSVPYAIHSANGFAGVSATGDTLYLANGNHLIVPGISSANDNPAADSTPHNCGTPYVHNALLTYGTMTDQEGNVYKTIVIGTQEWMAENLNTSIYRNGDEIPTDLDSAAWSSTNSGAWVYYNNDSSFACPYGKLYNWYSCLDARQLCPMGWHVPTEFDWGILIDHLGGDAVSGGKMKTTGTIETTTGLWHSTNAYATNSSGFSGVPGGVRYSGVLYYMIGDNGSWWSSTEIGPSNGRCLSLNNSQGNTFRSYNNKQHGFSVRCLRD